MARKAEKVEDPVIDATEEIIDEQPKVTSVKPKRQLQPIKGNYCPNCNQKIRVGLEGLPMCPEGIPECPRY